MITDRPDLYYTSTNSYVRGGILYMQPTVLDNDIYYVGEGNLKSGYSMDVRGAVRKQR